MSAALIVGAGDGTGAAVARRFAREGFTACVARRSASALTPLVEDIVAAGGQAEAFGLDAVDEAAVVQTVAEVEERHGPLEVLVYNSAVMTRGSILELTAEQVRQNWEVSALGGFLCGREAARRMVDRGRGTILFTGATASLKGSSGFGAFASGKFALRALAQSMARELGPKGIHVAHLVVDGIINVPRVHAQMPELAAQVGEDGMLDPNAIADAYWTVHAQPRNAWTHELDVRPFKERW
ncbi:MAG: SDR family NAD(P)-dependent oxidoreductase [Myxococcota bacterium]